MSKRISSLIGLIILLTGITAALSQEEPNFEQLAEDSREKAKASRLTDEVLVENYYKSVYEFHSWNIRHTQRALVWQHISGIIIFFVVLIVVFGGLYFSYVQFKMPDVRKNLEANRTSIKIGAAGVEVTSSFVGLLTLVTSLAFLYLYLENVYPLEIIDIKNTDIEEIEIQAPD